MIKKTTAERRTQGVSPHVKGGRKSGARTSAAAPSLLPAKGHLSSKRQ